MSKANYPIINVNDTLSTLAWQQLKYGEGYIAVGNINTSITEAIKIKPDIAEFSITYITEGDTPNDASNRNTKNMKNLKEYLSQLGIKDDNLTTVAYQNYENEKQQPIDNNSKRYRSTLTINLNIENEHVIDVVKLLDQYNISNIEQDSYHKFYIFNIVETSDSAEKAKQLNQDKYQSIVYQLNKLGIKDITVAGYDNRIASSDTEIVKKYYVKNTTKVKVNDLELIGKIIAKAQELKMTVNNDMDYSVSEHEKNRVLEQYQQTIYSKLAEKATRLLGKQYQLGVATNLKSDENSNIYSIQPRSYGYDSHAVLNVGQNQMGNADSIDIQPPSEFTITLTMSGAFEIVKQVNK